MVVQNRTILLSSFHQFWYDSKHHCLKCSWNHDSCQQKFQIWFHHSLYPFASSQPLFELPCWYKNTLLCFLNYYFWYLLYVQIKKLELIMYFSQKLLVTKCLKILGYLLSRLRTQHWFIPWVRCTFNDWFIHRTLLYDLTNKQAKKKNKQLLKMIRYKACTENVWKTMSKEKLWETFRKPAVLVEQKFLIERK